MDRGGFLARAWHLPWFLAFSACGGPAPFEGGTGGTSTAGATSTPLEEPLPTSEPVRSFDVDALATTVPSLQIEIGAAEEASLEADYWHAADVLGAFVGEDGARWDAVELNYRGAYALQTLIREGETRNWKVKFPDEQAYLGRREWNLNSEPHFRQHLAYDLMRFAGVPVVEADHVLLSVNGRSFGAYLRYADPDSKGWLKDVFGSAAGDLYKAAYDLPGEEQYFALLTYLGAESSAYFLHYDKKLNDEGAAAEDFSRLVTFLAGLNQTPEAELPAWLEANFEVPRFLSYLVVANFICNWDSYPQRPKNFWLYQSPVTSKWNYIPWDMDGTFQAFGVPTYRMSTDSSIFHEFDEYMGDGRNEAEGTERPLVRRMMAIPAIRDAYVARYHELLGGILSESYLQGRIDRLNTLLSGVVSGDAAAVLSEATDDMRTFVGERSANVANELEGL